MHTLVNVSYYIITTITSTIFINVIILFINITTAITGGGTHYLAFVQGAGTNPPKIDNDLE